MDAIDTRILELLQEDGRMPSAALADAVGLTPTPLRDRLKKLVESGAIRKYTAIVDPARVGRPISAFVQVELKSHQGLTNHNKFIELARSIPAVTECHHLAGEDDFLLRVVVRDIAELERVLLHRLTGSNLVSRVKTNLVLSSSKESAPIPVGPTDEERGEDT